MGIFLWIWARISNIFWILMPSRFKPHRMVFDAREQVSAATRKYEPSGLVKGLWWLLYLAILVIGVLTMWYVNSLFDLDKVLRSPWPWLHRYWLPLLFVLGYILFWLAWWLWKMLGPERETDSHRDIDEAWAEGVFALKEAGIDITQTPLFLILGRPSGSVDDLFHASQLPLQVRAVPKRAEAPLHVYANKEGIFVTCQGASLLGRAAELLIARPEVNTLNATLSPATNDTAAAPPELLNPSAPPAPEPAAEEEESAAESKPESSVAQMLLPEPTLGATMASPFVPRRQPLRLLQNIDEAERLTGRLKYLCRLIARQRHPFCSVNGVLVLAPLAATDSDADAHQTGLIIQRDLRSARESLRIRCPIQTALCDLESLPGFLEMMAQFTEGRQRQQLLGRPFPLVPQIDPRQFPRMISSGLEWLCQTMLPAVVYQFLHMERPDGQDAEQALMRNSRLVRLLGELRERQPRWGHILTQGVGVQDQQLPMLGGAFLCATGPDAAREQAFVHDVFRLLIENQNYVVWTPEALDEDRDYLRWARLSFVGIALLAAGFVFLLYYVVQKL